MLRGYELLTTTQQQKLAKAARHCANEDGVTYFVITYREGGRFKATIVDEPQWYTWPTRDEESILYTYHPGDARGQWTY